MARPVTPAFLMVLLLVPCGPAAQETTSGTVRDAHGAFLAGARIVVSSLPGTVLAETRTDAEGRFVLPALPPGRHVLVVEAAGFRSYRGAVGGSEGPSSIAVVLETLAHQERVTVTADRTGALDLAQSPQPVTVIPRDLVVARAPSVLAQAVTGEPGLALQRTSPTIAGVFVRGLTGNKVNVFVDGVRYSTSAARGGINTFLSLLAPSLVDRLEVLRGPASAQYGSDAIGGTLQVLTRSAPAIVGGARRAGAEMTASGATAEAGGSVDAAGAVTARGATLAGGVYAHRSGRLRTGGGRDSHAAITRFFGLPSSVVGDGRIEGSAFAQYGGFARAQWTPHARATCGPASASAVR